ncbi:hypothetical protein [Nostoc sp. FACHB-133]|nr:hypothetical protein [Nostoc sp. FACHB-133]MBD2524304.1 hypothetical protein [Nostoc sp. FACHB-133]
MTNRRDTENAEQEKGEGENISLKMKISIKLAMTSQIASLDADFFAK